MTGIKFLDRSDIEEIKRVFVTLGRPLIERCRVDGGDTGSFSDLSGGILCLAKALW